MWRFYCTVHNQPIHQPGNHLPTIYLHCIRSSLTRWQWSPGREEWSPEFGTAHRRPLLVFGGSLSHWMLENVRNVFRILTTSGTCFDHLAFGLKWFSRSLNPTSYFLPKKTRSCEVGRATRSWIYTRSETWYQTMILILKVLNNYCMAHSFKLTTPWQYESISNFVKLLLFTTSMIIALPSANLAWQGGIPIFRRRTICKYFWRVHAQVLHSPFRWSLRLYMDLETYKPVGTLLGLAQHCWSPFCW